MQKLPQRLAGPPQRHRRRIQKNTAAGTAAGAPLVRNIVLNGRSTADVDYAGAFKRDGPARRQLDGAATAQVRFRLTSDTNTTRDGWHIDDILLEAGDIVSAVIFTDGFESGDTSAWSNSVP